MKHVKYKVPVLNRDGSIVIFVSPKTTSIGASKKAGFPVQWSIVNGRGSWVEREAA